MSLEYPFDDAVVLMLGTLFGSFANVCLSRLPQHFFVDRILLTFPYRDFSKYGC